MSPKLAKKLLVFFLGVLLLLIAVLYQIKSTAPKNKRPQEHQTDLTNLLRNSLLQQRKNLQRCWLQNTTGTEQQVWQLFFTIESNGQVKIFNLLNRSAFSEETEKCLRETAMRLKFPAFEGEDISFTIPIRISSINDSH